MSGPHDHLFRQEAGRLVAALTRIFGVHNLALAEDVVQDSLCRAVEVWKFHGVPGNPAAWLMAAARNRALDVLRRERTARTFAPELGRLLESEWTLLPTLEEQLGAGAIKDDLLRMMFSCCHPRLPEPAQVALVLHILCGFGKGEIAAAFLTSEAAIEKRLQRGKKTLAASQRLSVQAVRAGLCGEAMRLVALLLEHPLAATPATEALAGLFCLHAARLPARVDAEGNLSSLLDQDRTRWDAALTAQGLSLLERSARGDELTAWHLEGAIAAVHARAPSAAETDWAAIVQLYDTLMRVAPSPVVGLSRAIAVAQQEGPERGLAELAALAGRERLRGYPFYCAALGELQLRCGRRGPAGDQFRAAISVARNPMEQRFLEQRLRLCGPP